MPPTRFEKCGDELVTALAAALPRGYEYVMILRDADGMAFFTNVSGSLAPMLLREVARTIEGS